MSKFKSQRKTVSAPAMTYSERTHMQAQSKLVYGNTSAYKKLLVNPQFIGGSVHYLTLEEADEVMTQILLSREQEIERLGKNVDRGVQPASGDGRTEEVEESTEFSGDKA